MIAGMLIVGLLIFSLCVALYCLVRPSDITECDEQVDETEAKPTSGCEAAVIVILALIVALSIALGGMIYSHTNQYIKPETEEFVEATECTTAPADTVDPTVETTEPVKHPVDIIPEETEVIPVTTEPIHIEETVPVTEPIATAPPVEVIPEPTTAPVMEEKEEPAGMSDVEMLACVIYQEAGGNGSCDNCRKYVADIVLNRVNDPRFPNDIHSVLTAPSQYGRFHWTGVKWAERAKYDTEKEAVARAYRIAEEVLAGQHSELYGNGYIWQAGFKQGTDGFWCCGHFYGR